MHYLLLNKRNFKFIFVLFFCFFFVHSAIAQSSVTFVLTSIPKYTPKNDSIFLVTSADNWVTDPHKMFKRYPDGLYRLTIYIDKTKKIGYKINRGNWNEAEGDQWGGFLPNREFAYNDSIYEVRLKVESWNDLYKTKSIQVLVTTIPENTPLESNLYISGNFNNWTVNDSNYKLVRGADKIYRGEIHSALEHVVFKFTRGNWTAVENRWDGGACSNRVFTPKDGSDNIINCTIQSWSDLSNGFIFFRSMNLSLILIAILILSLLLKYDKNKLLIGFLLLFIGTLSSKFYLPHPYFSFLSCLTYPFMYLILYLFLSEPMSKSLKRLSLISVPAVIPLIWFLKHLSLSSHEFILKVENNQLSVFLFGSYAVSIAYQCFLLVDLKKISSYIDFSNLTNQFIRVFLGACMCSVSIYIIGLVCLWLGVEIKLVMDWLDIFLCLNLGGILISFSWVFSVDFLSKKTRIDQALEDKTVATTHENWNMLKSKLNKLMDTKAIYTNPGLKLADIAKELGTNDNYVSKLINEVFDKNFTDYINMYRIQAFIESMKNEKENRKILYHAYRCGFNSKSAFNRAFKKVTNKTPSEYFAEEI